MATQLKISRLASALLGQAVLLALAALPAAGARADRVTTAECRTRAVRARVRLYPTDSNATELWLNGCTLTKIDPDAFRGLPELKTIYLEFNRIENINLAAFVTVPTLTKLQLQHNKLRELSKFNEGSCDNLTDLCLRFNKLTVIDNAGTFSACAMMQKLHLGYNGIEFIHPDVFSALTDLRTLWLNDNKIRFIPDRMLRSNGKLEQLYLHNNLITHLPPDFASRLKRAGASLNIFRFYGNPWHCACLVDLLADVQRAGVSDYEYEFRASLTHYEGIVPECNYISMREYPCSKIRELNFIVHGVR